MVRCSTLIALAAALGLGYGGATSVDDSKAPASGTPLKIGSRKGMAAAVPDIAKANGLPFESIQTPGSRPSDLRQKNDPVALAMIAGTAR
jgi:hypothetical protein